MRRAAFALPLAILAFSAGCPQQAGTGADGGPSSGLTADEQAAARAAMTSIRSLTDSVGVAQSTTSAAGQSAADLPSDASAGRCPAVSVDVDANGSAQTVGLAASIDFGAGCSPYGSENYSCSGSASGALSATGSSLNLSFNAVSCNGQTLSGSADVSVDADAAGVTLEGSFSLSYSGAEGTVDVDGSGACRHSRSDAVTEITRFDGSLKTGGESWNASMDALRVSYPQFESFVPFDGTLTLSAGEIRTVVIRFNAQSPLDGSIEVSLAGGPFVATTINDLLSSSL